MYAFRPDTFTNLGDYLEGGHRRLEAVWFRRRKGMLTATMGTYDLWLRWGRTGDDPPPPDTYDAWVARHTDNRYGGNHHASWDGVALLCTDSRVPPRVAAERIEFLTAMLAGYPDPPPGFDGWWTLSKAGTR
jgi:hypothetical protein